MKRSLQFGQQGAALLMMLIIVGLLGAFFALRSFNSQPEQAEKDQAALSMMTMAKDALLGFAAVNGRLPCPATAATAGIEAPVGGGVCTAPYIGFLPAATLGLPDVDATGYVLDPWGRRLRYSVTTANASAATTTDGIKTVTTATFSPDLRICTSATGTTGTACGTATALTTNAVAVLFSSGPNGEPGIGADELANAVANNNQVYVSHPRTDTTAANGEFDDIVTWLPTAPLFARMTQAGKLP
jgi:type II secretory pathway pseudopilin PulG